MNETHIPASLEVRKHDEDRKRRHAYEEVRAAGTVIFLSGMGWGVAAALWFLGGKL